MWKMKNELEFVQHTEEEMRKKMKNYTNYKKISRGGKKSEIFMWEEKKEAFFLEKWKICEKSSLN